MLVSFQHSSITPISRHERVLWQEKNMSYKKVVNLTPHVIRIQLSDESLVDFEPSGTVARVATKEVDAGILSADTLQGATARYPLTDISLSRVEYGEVEGLPVPVEGTVYLVSGMVAARVPMRGDVYAPNSGSTAIRKDGQVWAVRSLIPAVIDPVNWQAAYESAVYDLKVSQINGDTTEENHVKQRLQALGIAENAKV